MKKLKENFLESPPRHPRQLITMIKQNQCLDKTIYLFKI